MSAPCKKIIQISCIILILSVVVFIGIVLFRNIMSQREQEARMDAERMAQRQIAETYVRLHYSFRIVAVDPAMHKEVAFNIGGQYLPLPDAMSSQSPFGISSSRYLLLRMYYHRTGVILAYETVVDYFSQEFESDGSLRLYNNGKHPEIEAFVTWMWEGQRRLEAIEHGNSARDVYWQYVHDHRDSGFISHNFSYLSPQMLDAIARAVANPDYVLDLTSLQQQGY